ncbi:MAG: YciI family protein [Gemmatimonadota bacterium]
MYAIAILRYRRPLEEVVVALEDHRAYLRSLKEKGLLVASGPAHPRNGGMLILRVPDDDVIASLDRIRDGDPYYQRELAQYELIQWAPTIGKDELDRM